MNSTRYATFDEFRIMLKVLEIYGCGYFDDIDKTHYNRRLQLSHSQQAVDEIYEIVYMIQKTITEINEHGKEIFSGEDKIRFNLS